ncbi:S8 family peptidase [Bacillus paramycoides]|uniref:S8 family peptidase n=1 Tax=Bacillus paramycoides TaxID=2026194 RepID=UPI002E1C0E4B|nr:S8 family peptidase [Bacillus paramycoides]
MNHIIESPFTVKSIVEDPQQIPYGIDTIKARQLWETGRKGEGIVIAVMDTGCDTTHPDLEGSIIGGYNFTDDDEGNPEVYMDYRGHGTHVSGIIAARENDIGVVGVAPRSKLLILKTINKTGKGKYENVIKAINYAIDWRGPNNERVSIINMSLGGTLHDDELYRTIKQARKQGILLVVASGNDGDGKGDTSEINYPGFYQEVIQVGSIDQNEKLSSFSNTNINLDFVAPGSNILSTYLDGRYAKLSGTSMATPHVSGSLALIINTIPNGTYNPTITSFLAYSYLVEHAKTLNLSIFEEGNGLIQLV